LVSLVDLIAGETDLADLTDRLDALIGAATRADAIAPLGEHVLLCLHRGDQPGHHRVRFADTGALVGYLHLEPDADGPVAEFVVHPTYRRRGHGRALLTAELDAARSGGGSLRAWSHGGLRPARALARELGLRPVRELWTMTRPLDAPLPDVPLPGGVSLRSFRPGADDAEWLALNALAFAHHPEQGHWQPTDLQDRIAAPWFDADGFLVAERDGRMAGYHWTKVHPGDADGEQPPVGEVYVVGVDPAEQGHGLGRALTVAGLRRLAEQGLGAAMLYVDESNTAARKVYEALGFVRSGTDVMYATAAADSSDDQA
jgi:mycothiol synthase